MAYPVGSGSEVLKRTLIHAQSNDPTAFRWDGTMATVGTETYTVTATHIITIVSIVACEQAGTDEDIHLYMHDGTNTHQYLQDQSLPAKSTYVWNDRFVLYGGDKLIVNLSNAGNVDFICSYIDQDWT